MAHRRRPYDERRRSQEGEDFRASPGRYGDGSRDRDEGREDSEYYEQDRRKRFEGRQDETRGSWEREGRGSGEEENWDEEGKGEQDRRARERERSRDRRHRRSRSSEYNKDREEYRDRDEYRDREDYREREWRRSPGRDRSRRRWRDSSRDRSPSYPSDSNHKFGEWNCRCGALNFKRRFTCYRQYCGASRNDAVSVVPIEKPSIPGTVHSKRMPINAPIPPKQTYTLEDVPGLAAYSAQMYAGNVQEQATYLKYYTDYYTQQLAMTQATESDKVNAAAAVAQSAINQLQARTAVTVPPTGSDNRMYPIPDTSTYLYDETSGYYYDTVTGLYYDPNTQYYFNNQINQYLYWDMTKFTYVLATAAQQALTPAPQMASTPLVAAAPAVAETSQPEEKKKTGEKQDKVKVAKKIAKDMERWAKTMNQKKEMARTNSMPETSNSNFAASVSADIGFSVLEQRVPVNSAPPVIAPPPPPTLVPSYGAGSDSSGDESENIIDWNKLACLLCKRQFPSRDVLEKHQVMSDLHRQNLEALKGKRGNNRDMGYRDRAAERRMKYGEDDPPIVRNVRPDPVMSSIPQAIGEENIGNKLLQKMGWSAGQGLGKDGQGRVGPVEATTGGLGKKKGIYTAGPGETYKECVKKLTMARYQDLIGSEGNT